MSNRISSIVLYVLGAITVVIAALFYLGGYVDPNAEYVEPVFTQELVLLMYAFVAIAAVLVLVSQTYHFCKRLASNPKQAIKSIIGVVATALLLIITYVCASGEPVKILGSDELLSTTWYKLVEMQLYSMYILCAIGLLLVIFGNFAKKIK